MKYVSFSNQDKIKFFDELAETFMGKNFSHITKADVELLLFHFYISKMIENNKNEDGTIDYLLCSDYKISHDLGITQQRVRNLKVKNQLIYPIEFDWKMSLASLTNNARFDEKSRKIIINIPDPNLFLEIQNHLENQGSYIEMQLNSKILQIRVEYFIDLILSLESEENKKKIIKKLKKEFKEHNKDEKIFEGKNLGEFFIDNQDLFLEMIKAFSSIISCFSPTNKPLVATIMGFFNNPLM